MKSCPMCGREDYDDVLVCPSCGYSFKTGTTQAERTGQPATPAEVHYPGGDLVAGGILLSIIGFAIMVISLFMGTTIEGSGGLYGSSETHNIGLMQTQQNTLHWGSALLIAGLILYVGGAIMKNVLKALANRPSA